ncbi:MAG: CDP-alcohol phosphatidyltransferase family protein [Jiangellaceae bacterium]
MSTATSSVVVLGLDDSPIERPSPSRPPLVGRLEQQLLAFARVLVPVADTASGWSRVADVVAGAVGPVGVVDATYVGHASPLGDTIADNRWGSAVLVDDGGVRGVLRVGPADLAAAHAAAQALSSDGATVRTAVLADRLAAAGVELRPVGPGPYVVGFAEEPDRARALLEQAVGADEHRLRMAASARSDDGFYSTFVLRRLSRHLTAGALRLGLRPDTVTVLSLLIGLAAAVCFGIGERWALVAGAVLLQVSLVVDCVDGEVARYTRRYSAFGAWLDGVSDRVKEFAVYAGLAGGAARSGANLWLLAGVTMALLVVRHHVDFGFAIRQQARTVAGRPSGDRLGPRGGALPRLGQGAAALSERTDDSPVARWAKRVVIMPIGERWLVISIAALWGPRTVFVALLATGTVAALYTTIGRVMRSVAENVAVRGAELRDLALLTEVPVGVPAEPPPGWLGHRLGWLAPALSRAGEFGVVLAVAAAVDGAGPAAAFAVLAAVGLHLYDLVYRLRHLRRPPARWASMTVLGAVVRPAVLMVAGAVGPTAFSTACAAMAALLVTVSGVDGRAAWTDGPLVAGRPTIGQATQ